MLRLFRSTAFLGTLLIAGTAAAQSGESEAADAKKVESGKPATPPSDKPASSETKKSEATPAPVAVPAPPPPTPEPQVEVAKSPRKRSIESAGLNTQTTTVGGGADLGDTTSEKDWGFKFKGFFRAPMRVGIDNSGNLTPGKIQLHAIPAVPDGNYTRWMYTNLNPGPWAEMLFQYGNQRVMMTTSIASYNITSGGWRELQDQLGIDRAFLTLKFPEALGNLGGMAWDVGIFSNRYGGMGKYDAGQYETYIIGRTRVAGVTATADMEVSDDIKLIIEGGIGAKVDQMYQRYDASAKPTYDYPTWMPYPGEDVQNGTNALVHIHGGAVFRGIWTLQAHYINSFVKDARWNVGNTGGSPDVKPASNYVPGEASIQVAGLDLKLDGGWMGEGYIGYSWLKANNAGAVNDSIEVLHSQGGWQLAKNFFPDGDGTIHTVAFQYTFSLAAFLMRPRPFWGQAADITVRPFMMLNKVTGTTGGSYDMTKLKYGADVVYSPWSMMAMALRFDSVNPNMNNNKDSFFIIAPRLIFRSEFVTHEMIVLQYSHYFYGDSYKDPNNVERVMPWPFGQYGTYNLRKLNSTPDEHVITLYASMWW
jgi:hypothetical protein